MDGKDGVCVWGEKSKSFEREKHSCLFLREQGKWCVCVEGAGNDGFFVADQGSEGWKEGI